jgi:hypothetical protein
MAGSCNCPVPCDPKDLYRVHGGAYIEALVFS